MKQGGLLEQAIKQHRKRICQNCGNLVKVSNTALGCVAHDKFILPDYPPLSWELRMQGLEGGIRGMTQEYEEDRCGKCMWFQEDGCHYLAWIDRKPTPVEANDLGCDNFNPLEESA